MLEKERKESDEGEGEGEGERPLMGNQQLSSNKQIHHQR